MEASEYIRFAILLDKVPGRETSKDVIQRHVAHLRELDVAGKLVLSGPFTDFPSGMIIVKVANKAEAEAIAQADPFVIEGARTPKVYTWLLACAENNYLI